MQTRRLKHQKSIEEAFVPSYDEGQLTNKRIPYKFYLAYKKLSYKEDDYKRVRIQQRYHRTLKVDCGEIYLNTRSYNLLRLSKKLKCLKNIEIKNILFSHKVSLTNLYHSLRSLTRLIGIKLEFGEVYIPQSEAEITRIKSTLKSIKANLKKLIVNIFLGTGANIVLSWLTVSIINAIQPMSKLRIFCLDLPRHASKSGTIFQQEEDMYGQNNRLIRFYQLKFQRKSKLESLHLPFIISHHPMFTSFTNKFNHLLNLRNLEVVSPDIAFGKQLVEELKSLENLVSLTIYHHIEPNDLLELLDNLPTLRKLTIKDEWLFPETIEPEIEYQMINQSNIEQLDLDFPIEIDSEDKAIFFASFLRIFENLTALKLYICCEENITFLQPIAEFINNLELLKELTLGTFLRSGKVLSLFLKSLHQIRNLEKLAMTYKLSMGGTWDQNIETLFKAIDNFLLRNKSLKRLEMYWEKFSLNCIEYLRETMQKLAVLDSFHLVYIPADSEHGQTHDQILDVVSKIFIESKQFQEISVITSCRKSSYGGCKQQTNLLNEEFRKKKKLNTCNFSIKTLRFLWTPFYKDGLVSRVRYY